MDYFEVQLLSTPMLHLIVSNNHTLIYGLANR